VAVNSIYASIIPSYKYNLVLKSFSYGTQVMGHPVHEFHRIFFLRLPAIKKTINIKIQIQNFTFLKPRQLQLFSIYSYEAAILAHLFA
jgi:hypothetical protein